MASQEKVRVQVVYALPHRQEVVSTVLPVGSTARDAVMHADIQARFPEADFSALPLGIYGEAVDPDRRLEDGDRVEIYRPLQMDPREARRQRAEAEGSAASARGSRRGPARSPGPRG